MEQAADIINKASAKKTSGTSSQSKKQAPYSKINSNLQFVDHIWAKNGEVYWRSRNGQTGHMSPNEAIRMADQVNKDITKFAKRPDVGDVAGLKRQRDELVSKLIHAYRKAGQQRKNPENKDDELLSYAWHGQNRRGEPFTAEMVFNEEILERKKKDYPFLSEEDIIQFLKSPSLSPQEAERMLQAENAKRETQHYNPNVTKQVTV